MHKAMSSGGGAGGGEESRRDAGSDVRVNSSSTTLLRVKVGVHEYALNQQPASMDHGLAVWDAVRGWCLVVGGLCGGPLWPRAVG